MSFENADPDEGCAVRVTVQQFDSAEDVPAPVEGHVYSGTVFGLSDQQADDLTEALEVGSQDTLDAGM
jgi:hypothetical protein